MASFLVTLRLEIDEPCNERGRALIEHLRRAVRGEAPFAPTLRAVAPGVAGDVLFWSPPVIAVTEDTETYEPHRREAR